MRAKKKKYPRIFIYKAYKIMCKLLGAVAICYGKTMKKSEAEAIYAEKADGKKFKLYLKNSPQPLALSKKKQMAVDMQKAIVEKILSALEKDDIVILDDRDYYQFSRIKKGTCFEQLMIENELDGSRSTLTV